MYCCAFDKFYRASLPLSRLFVNFLPKNGGGSLGSSDAGSIILSHSSWKGLGLLKWNVELPTAPDVEDADTEAFNSVPRQRYSTAGA